MTEPTEQQEPTDPQESAETSTPPGEPPDESDESEPPDESDERQGDEQGYEPAAESQDESPEAMEKAFGKLDNEAVRHAKRVNEIMGEQALALLPCELCAPLIPGFRWPQVPENQRAAVMLAIGFEPEPEYENDTQSYACPDCKGWGYVKTGSKVKGQDALTCTSCKGKGWRGPREQAPPMGLAESLAAAPSNGPPSEVPLSPDREAARQAAEALGFMVIDTTPAAPA